jgi:hypothetical protein
MRPRKRSSLKRAVDPVPEISKLNRRDALRLLAAGAAIPLMPAQLVAMREARAFLGASGAPRALNPHQFETVKTMAEMILPRTDTPGATDVGASDFIDLILTEWCSEAERSRFLSGLADVDSRARSLFGKDFSDCSLTQQGDILAALGEKMVEDAEALREVTRPSYAPRSEAPKTFYAMLRRWTLTAYYTSEAGATAELHFEIIPDRYDPCAPSQSNKEAPTDQ